MNEKQMWGQSLDAADFLKNIEGEFVQKKVFFIAQYSDRIKIGGWKEGTRVDENKLLELRVFDEDKEWKLFRSDLGSNFSWRCRGDKHSDGTELIKGKDYFDEIQFLDIDIPRSKNASQGVKFTTAGGSYCLPVNMPDLDRAGILIRHYFGVEAASGQAFIKDYRCVGFQNAEKKDYCKDLKGEK